MSLSAKARSRACWLSLLVGTVMSTPGRFAHAETIEPVALDRAPLALTQSLRTIWQRNPAVQAAQARLAAAQARADAAGRPIYNPELELAAENADVDRRSVGISQTIDWSGKRRARSGAASAEVLAASAERDLVRQRVALEWIGGFAAYRVAADQVELGRQRQQLLSQFATLAQRRFVAGDIPQLERDLAELALQEARARQAELLADQAKARRTLANVSSGEITLPELPRGLPAAVVLPLPAAAIESLPAIRQAQAETEVAMAKVTVAERDRRPDPTLSLTGGRVRSGPVSDNIIGLSLRIPLFVRNDYSAEVSAARASADEADANFRDLRQRAAAEAEQAGVSYNALHDAWQAWEQSKAARISDRAALLQRLWEAGELSTADYLVQLKQSIETELTAVGLRARVWQAWADWLAASGAAERWLGMEAP
ncbi:TolC family protein [Rudaea sp.]|uniref:TolC family protein n=1 Tax=Rudaea sp. TaxID=2136325 RepID=UPI002ED28240